MQNIAKKNAKGDLELTTVYSGVEISNQRNMIIAEVNELRSALAFKEGLLRDINRAVGKADNDETREALEVMKKV